MEMFTVTLFFLLVVVFAGCVAANVMGRVLASDRIMLEALEGVSSIASTPNYDLDAPSARVPLGTMGFLLGFLMMTAGLWGAMYLIMIQRS